MFTTNNLTKQPFSETISWSNILTRGVGTRGTGGAPPSLKAPKGPFCLEKCPAPLSNF